ncbi:MAG: DUF4249 family protein [Bacteroidales bacterium]|nr:DUF4249 family protein [Bacteroidales bacterium]
MKRKTTHLLFVLAISLGLLSACTERIDIDLQEEFTKLAVEGYVSRGNQEFAYVKLTKTSGYFSNEAAPPVSGATVAVTDGNDVFLFNEDVGEPGYYRPPGNFPGDADKTYQLKINLARDISGESYFEASETMPPLSDQIDSIRVVYRSDFEFWAVEFYGYDPPGPNYYMFHALRNGLLITDSISKVNITDDKLVDDIYIYGAYVMVFDRTQLNPGDRFTLITSSITKGYFDFITELQTEIHPKNPLFSGPPANVSSNLSSGAVGYFAAFPSVYTETVVR